MRIFQNAGLYPSYLPRLERLCAGAHGFRDRLDIFLADRYGACHHLLPVLERSPQAFFTNADDLALQRAWAAEHGMKADADPADILLAQIEEHRTEVFYNSDPMRFGNAFLKRLPGSVRKSIAWRSAPSAGGQFGDYDLIVCNFPSIIEGYRQQGWRSDYLSPAHDPQMDPYAARTDRPIDILFVGGYTRHHTRRARILEAVAALHTRFNVAFHLDRSRLTRLAESPLGRLLPLSAHRRPAVIQAVTREPVFGRDLYEVLSQSKIVLNGAVDMAGQDRGNMRCFEAMGCGALMVSDEGRYPQGMADGATMRTYADDAQAPAVITRALENLPELQRQAASGHALVQSSYSKQTQWQRFQDLVEAL